MSPGLVTVCAEGGVWVPVALLGKHSTRNGEVMGLMPAWVSQTFFSTDCGSAQSAMYIFKTFMCEFYCLLPTFHVYTLSLTGLEVEIIIQWWTFTKFLLITLFQCLNNNTNTCLKLTKTNLCWGDNVRKSYLQNIFYCNVLSVS